MQQFNQRVDCISYIFFLIHTYVAHPIGLQKRIFNVRRYMPYIPHTPFKFSRDDVLLTTIITTTQKPVYKDMKCPILEHPAHEYSARHAEHKHYENWILFCCLFLCFRLSPPFSPVLYLVEVDDFIFIFKA